MHVERHLVEEIDARLCVPSMTQLNIINYPKAYCRNSGIRQFRLLYICLLEQQHMTLSAPIHSRQLPISSFFLCKKGDTKRRHQENIKQ
jgi:hypothetical protein